MVKKTKLWRCCGLIYSLISSVRSLWEGMLVVASFVQHVVLKVQRDDSRLKELALKHCNLHLNVHKSVFVLKLWSSI